MTTGDSSYTATGTMLIRSDSELERLRLEHAGDLQDVAGNDEDNDDDNDNYNGDNVIDNGNIDNNPMYVSDAAIDFDPEADSPTASFDVEAQQRQSQRRRRADSSHFVTAENTMTEEDAEAASGIVGELALAALADALGECDDDPVTTTHGTIHGSDRGTIHGPSHGTIHGPSHATSHVAIDFDDGMATTKISPMRGMDEGRHEAPAWTRSQLKDIFSPLTLEEMFQQKERTASAEIDADAAEVHCEEAVNVADDEPSFMAGVLANASHGSMMGQHLQQQPPFEHLSFDVSVLVDDSLNGAGDEDAYGNAAPLPPTSFERQYITMTRGGRTSIKEEEEDVLCDYNEHGAPTNRILENAIADAVEFDEEDGTADAAELCDQSNAVEREENSANALDQAKESKSTTAVALVPTSSVTPSSPEDMRQANEDDASVAISVTSTAPSSLNKTKSGISQFHFPAHLLADSSASLRVMTAPSVHMHRESLDLLQFSRSAHASPNKSASAASATSTAAMVAGYTKSGYDTITRERLSALVDELEAHDQEAPNTVKQEVAANVLRSRDQEMPTTTKNEVATHVLRSLDQISDEVENPNVDDEDDDAEHIERVKRLKMSQGRWASPIDAVVHGGAPEATEVAPMTFGAAMQASREGFQNRLKEMNRSPEVNSATANKASPVKQVTTSTVVHTAGRGDKSVWVELPTEVEVNIRKLVRSFPDLNDVDHAKLPAADNDSSPHRKLVSDQTMMQHLDEASQLYSEEFGNEVQGRRVADLTDAEKSRLFSLDRAFQALQDTLVPVTPMPVDRTRQVTYEDSSFGPNTTITTSAPGSPIAARRQFLEMLEHVEATTTNLDLSNHGLDTVYDMESVFSSLQSVNLARNQLHSAAGLPSTVLKLQMSHNLLSDLSTFYHLPNLQELDISQNTITSLRCLGPLVHLRTLTANSCEILRLDGLECLAGVMKVSLDGNMITDLMLASGGQLVLPALEELSLGCNRMEVLGGLEGLSALKSLSVAGNKIRTMRFTSPCTSITTLDMSDNQLTTFDVAAFPCVERLYLTRNRLAGAAFHGRGRELRALSVLKIDQQANGGRELTIDYCQFRDCAELVVAGNTLRSLDPLMGFFKLTTLDARQCHLKSLPTALHRGLPNLRELNLSHNTIRDIAPLAKLHRLRKLVLVDNELESVSECVTVLRGLEKLEELDLRMNPITAKFYPAVDVTMADGMSTAWPRQVAAFVSTLNDAAFVKRMCYRTAMIHGLTGRLTSLDGLLVDNGERKRAALQYTKLRASMASVMHDSSTSSVAPTPQKAHPVSLKWEAADLSMASGSYSSEVRGTAAQVREAPTHATSMPSATASTDLFSKDTANLLQRVERLRLGSKSQAAHPPSQGHATATNDTSSAHRNPAPQTFWVGFDSAPSTTLPALPAPPKRFTEHRQSVQPRKVKFHRESSSALKQRPLTVLPKNHAKPIIKSRAKSAATVPSFMARPQDRLYRPSTVSRHVEPAVHRYVVYSSNGKPMVLTRPAEERPSYYLPPPRRG